MVAGEFETQGHCMCACHVNNNALNVKHVVPCCYPKPVVNPILDAEFQRGYELGLKHGIEQEREKWMNQIHGIVSDAIEEAIRSRAEIDG